MKKLEYQNNILIELVDGTFELLPNASGVRLIECDCGYSAVDGSWKYPQGRIVAYMIIEPFKTKQNMNLFDNAKFGDKFLTKDNRIALYLYDSRHCTQPSRGGHRLYLDSKDVNGKGCNGLYGEISCDDNGFCSTHMIKIVSKYNE